MTTKVFELVSAETEAELAKRDLINRLAFVIDPSAFFDGLKDEYKRKTAIWRAEQVYKMCKKELS